MPARLTQRDARAEWQEEFVAQAPARANVSAWMGRHNVSAVRLAEMSDPSRVSLGGWLRGQANLRFYSLVCLSRATGMTLAQMFTSPGVAIEREPPAVP